MILTLEQTREIARDAILQAINGGFSLKRCVWEFSPSVLSTLIENGAALQANDPNGFLRFRYLTIPCRRNCDEDTGIMLRLVWPEPWG